MDVIGVRSSRVALIACSATKSAVACSARDLYAGQLFRLSREWVELRAAVYPRWAILSARHGVVLPDTILEPYETTISDVDAGDWRLLVRGQLDDLFGRDRIYAVLAGRSYVAGLHDFPFVEDLFATWQESHRFHHPRRRWGIGTILQKLTAENDAVKELRAAATAE